MEVKGVAFLARKQSIINKFGEEKWKQFMNKLKEEDNYFNTTILATTWIPVEKFLKFQDAVTNEFFGGDNTTLWELGEQSAEYGLKEGPYKVFIQNKDVRKFTEQAVPMIWSSYYTEGQMIAKYDGTKVDIIVKDLPVKHAYFEFVPMGYVKRAYEIISGKSVKLKKINEQSDSKGYSYHYELHFT